MQARETVDLRIARLERSLAGLRRKVAEAAAGSKSPGAVFDGLMEASAELARAVTELEATRVTLTLMRTLWDEAQSAGYARRDAELAREGDGRRLRVVRAAS